MKKLMVSLVLGLVLLLALGSAALAIPVTAPAGGSFTVFGDFGDWWGDPIAGIAYGITDSFAAGLELEIDGGPELAVFSQLTLEPFNFSAQYFFTKSWLFVDGKYLIGLDPLTIGLGLSVFVDFIPTVNADYGLKASLDLALTDSISVYGNLSYWLIDGAHFEVGAGLTF